jgi:hypothetical protein
MPDMVNKKKRGGTCMIQIEYTALHNSKLNTAALNPTCVRHPNPPLNDLQMAMRMTAPKRKLLHLDPVAQKSLNKTPRTIFLTPKSLAWLKGNEFSSKKFLIYFLKVHLTDYEKN